MSTPQPLIEAYIYHRLDSARTLSLTQGGAAQSLTLTATQTVRSALTSWEAAANGNAALSGTFTMSFNESSESVTIASTSAFAYEMPHSLRHYLGFRDQTNTGSSSYSTSMQMLGVWTPMSLDYDAPTPAEDSKLLEFRAGRGLAQSWNQTNQFKMRIKDTSTRIAAHLSGPIGRGGLVKISPTTERAAPYSITQLDGYLVASIYAVDKVRAIGQAEELAEVTLSCQLSQVLA